MPALHGAGGLITLFPLFLLILIIRLLFPNNVDETLFQCVFKYKYTLDLDYLSKVSSISLLYTNIYKARGTESLSTVSHSTTSCGPTRD